MSFANAFANLFRIQELRKRLVFTLALLAVYRVGVFVTTPGVDREVMQKYIESVRRLPRPVQPVLGRRARAALDLRARHHAVRQSSHHPAAADGGRACRSRSSRKEGETGRRKINAVHPLRHDRALARPGLRHRAAASRRVNAPAQDGVVVDASRAGASACMTMLTLTTGTAFIMWLGEQITERGIGNGISLIIFAGIVAGMPRPPSADLADVQGPGRRLDRGPAHPDRGHAARRRRRSSSSSAASAASRCSTPSASSAGKMYGGQSTHLPLKVNTAGVIPPIFASLAADVPGDASRPGSAPRS